MLSHPVRSIISGKINDLLISHPSSRTSPYLSPVSCNVLDNTNVMLIDHGRPEPNVLERIQVPHWESTPSGLLHRAQHHIRQEEDYHIWRQGVHHPTEDYRRVVAQANRNVTVVGHNIGPHGAWEASKPFRSRDPLRTNAAEDSAYKVIEHLLLIQGADTDHKERMALSDWWRVAAWCALRFDFEDTFQRMFSGAVASHDFVEFREYKQRETRTFAGDAGYVHPRRMLVQHELSNQKSKYRNTNVHVKQCVITQYDAQLLDVFHDALPVRRRRPPLTQLPIFQPVEHNP
jgi:hypothetical protein